MSEKRTHSSSPASFSVRFHLTLKKNKTASSYEAIANFYCFDMVLYPEDSTMNMDCCGRPKVL